MALSLAGSLLAHAPDVMGQDVAAAEALFREGRALMDQGKYAVACKKLAESQRLDASSGTLLNLAACHEKEGKTATAWAEFLVAARLAKTQGRADRAEEARKQAAALEPKLSYLTIRVAKKVPGLEIRRGDVVLEASTLGSKLPTDPGDHTITISAPGHEPMTMQVTVGAEADAQTLSVPALQEVAAAAPAPAAVTPAPPPESPRPPQQDTPARVDSGSNTAAYVIGGAGVAALTVGSVFGVMALSTYGKADDACPTHQGCSSGATDDRGTAGTQANIANVGIGLGIVGIGVGAVLLMTGGGDGESATRPPRPRGLDVRTGLDTGKFGFDLSGSF
jgi:hypothetical protein